MTPPRGSGSWLATLGAVSAIAIALGVGCAAGEADTDAVPANGDGKTDEASESNSTTADRTENKPAFDAEFGDAGAPKTTPKDEDPAPPGGGDTCVDNNDVGGTEAAARRLDPINDCDNDYKEVSGVSTSQVDVDVYAVAGTDNGPSIHHPGGCSLDTDFEMETAGAQICVFMRCQNTTKDAVTGCDQGTPTTNDLGMKGCCAPGPGHALPKWDCSGLFDNDSADIFVRVKQTSTNKCMPYKFKYRF